MIENCDMPEHDLAERQSYEVRARREDGSGGWQRRCMLWALM
jgi:hypothetical protein